MARVEVLSLELTQTASKFENLSTYSIYLHFYGVSPDFMHGVTSATNLQTSITEQIAPISCFI